MTTTPTRPTLTTAWAKSLTRRLGVLVTAACVGTPDATPHDAEAVGWLMAKQDVWQRSATLLTLRASLPEVL